MLYEKCQGSKKRGPKFEIKGEGHRVEQIFRNQQSKDIGEEL